MRRSRPLRSRKRLRSVNPERKATLRDKQYGDDAFQRWIHRLECMVPGCHARDVEQAHAVSRAAGGTWEDSLPLCRSHHREQHQAGILTFEKRHGFDLRAAAREVQKQWSATHG